MVSDRPLIPKRLAARIRHAQGKVAAARDTIIHNERSIEQDRKRIAEFEANPALFARTHYGMHGVESYPVQTNIARCRERLEYRTEKLQSTYEGLREAEEDLQSVEREVLDLVPAFGEG